MITISLLLVLVALAFVIAHVVWNVPLWPSVLVLILLHLVLVFPK